MHLPVINESGLLNVRIEIALFLARQKWIHFAEIIIRLYMNFLYFRLSGVRNSKAQNMLLTLRKIDFLCKN